MKIWKYLDDLLFLAGCICILIGLSMWSAVITWIAAGIMLIVFSLMYAKKVANDSQRPDQE
jgi:hypothetical protein